VRNIAAPNYGLAAIIVAAPYNRSGYCPSDARVEDVIVRTADQILASIKRYCKRLENSN